MAELQLQHEPYALQAVHDVRPHSPSASPAGFMSLSATQLLAIAEEVSAREADKWASRLADAEQVRCCVVDVRARRKIVCEV